jgi:hypothetical protein
MIDQSMTIDQPSAETYGERFPCLSNPTRIRILGAIATAVRAVTVREVVEVAAVSQSTASLCRRRSTGPGSIASDSRSVRSTSVRSHRRGTRITPWGYACHPSKMPVQVGLVVETAGRCHVGQRPPAT